MLRVQGRSNLGAGVRARAKARIRARTSYRRAPLSSSLDASERAVEATRRMSSTLRASDTGSGSVRVKFNMFI